MVWKGQSIVEGIAIGRLAVYGRKDSQARQCNITDTDAEIARFHSAREAAKVQLAAICEKAKAELGEESAMIFEAQGMLLEDSAYLEFIVDRIVGQKVNAEYAVELAGEEFSQRFEALGDEYLRQRAADVQDVSRRVIVLLAGVEKGAVNYAQPVILVAEELTPGEVMGLDRSKVLGIVTRFGSVYSHAAILARGMGIPMLAGVEFGAADSCDFEDKDSVSDERNRERVDFDKMMGAMDGTMAIVDSNGGKLILEPKEAQLAEYRCLQETMEQEKKALLTEIGQENITLDGKKIELYANVGNVADVTEALVRDAGGIGLFRSEFLYLESEDYPTEEAQFTAYRTVAEKMEGKPVIIRTLDVGADKQPPYFHMEKEENPALGYRGIRVCLDKCELFKTQLRAIYRASNYGRIAIMFPMIISLQEVQRIKEILEEVKTELTEEGIPYKNCEIGIMLETPAAVMISDLLAKEVDFFSVGTNDLTQYTLAMDRQNTKLCDGYDKHHEAILRMLQMAVDNGHKRGCRVGICGELAADTTLTETLLKMGFDELSVSPSLLLGVRAAIRKSRID